MSSRKAPQEFQLPGQQPEDEAQPAPPPRPAAAPPRARTASAVVPVAPAPAGAPPAPRRPTVEAQTGFDASPPRRQTRDSVFAVDELEEMSKVEMMLQGKVRPKAPPVVKRTQTTQQMRTFGEKYAAQVADEVKVTGRHLAPLAAPLQSQPGARHPVLTTSVLEQFRAADNPRYAKGERGHLFIWDATTALGCGIPLYKGGGRLTLEDVVSWFRTLANGRGWVRVSTLRALELCSKGHPVIALPKGNVEARIALCRPGPAGRDGAPLLVSACRNKKGTALSTQEALGARAAEYHFHP